MPPLQGSELLLHLAPSALRDVVHRPAVSGGEPGIKRVHWFHDALARAVDTAWLRRWNTARSAGSGAQGLFRSQEPSAESQAWRGEGTRVLDGGSAMAVVTG